jgi:hypothetical protein
MSTSAIDTGTPPATEGNDPNCPPPPVRPVRQRLLEIAEKLSDVGCALVEAFGRVIYGLEGPLPARCGSLNLAMDRVMRAAGLVCALLLRIRAGIVVTARPAAPKDMAKQPRKRAPTAGLGLPRGKPDPATVLDRMTDAEAFARICKDLTLAAKAIGYTDIVAEVAELAREAAELLARPPAPLPRARLAEAEIQRRRAERAAAAVMASEGSSVACAAAMPPLPPDSG